MLAVSALSPGLKLRAMPQKYQIEVSVSGVMKSTTMLDAAGVTGDADYPLDGVSLLKVLKAPQQTFPRPMHWRMNHRGQRALRDGDWKYLRVDGNDYLFNIPADERERANQGQQQPERLAAMKADWEAWNASMPPIPDDATVSLGYSAKDMPQR